MIISRMVMGILIILFGLISFIFGLYQTVTSSLVIYFYILPIALLIVGVYFLLDNSEDKIEQIIKK